MKKCKITLAPKAKQRFFYLAPNASTLYFLAVSSSKKKVRALLKSHPDIDVISLSHGQWLEVEWAGCQNMYDGIETVRVNCVRLIRASKLSSSDDRDPMISAHLGWMYMDDLKFTNHRKAGMKVKMLETSDEQFNFAELFEDDEDFDATSKPKNKMVN